MQWVPGITLFYREASIWTGAYWTVSTSSTSQCWVIISIDRQSFRVRMMDIYPHRVRAFFTRIMTLTHASHNSSKSDSPFSRVTTYLINQSTLSQNKTNHFPSNTNKIPSHNKMKPLNCKNTAAKSSSSRRRISWFISKSHRCLGTRLVWFFVIVGQNKEPLKKIRKIELLKEEEGEVSESGGKMFRNRENSAEGVEVGGIW